MLLLDHLQQRGIESAINAPLSATLNDITIDIVNLGNSSSEYVLPHRADVLRSL